MAMPKIKSFRQVVPMLYAYATPGIPYHQGWLKIGYTDRQSVEDRVKQQTHTANIKTEIVWSDNAMYKDGSGEYFTDRDFHYFLEVEMGIQRESGTEWFKIDFPTLLVAFDNFARRKTIYADKGMKYRLREEQGNAVQKTFKYFKYKAGKEFLWNAKPRFGKTLTCYDLIRKLGYRNVLIVTNRPSIANSWLDDFNKFIGWRGEYCFVSETDALSGKKGVMSYNQYISTLPRVDENRTGRGLIAFESLQGLKGSVYFGGEYNKLEWIKNTEWDLLVIDESQEGVDTVRTDQAFKSIHASKKLYLSGTPFKQLASSQFSEEQIFNWSYADEQAAKAAWNKDESNPYALLPKLNLYTYQLSNMIYDKIKQGADITEEYTVDYTFDLNEFFLTNESGRFVHEDEVKRFLSALTKQEKYPYSTEELRKELSHTLWLFNRVSSAKAMKRLLAADPVFKEYKVVLAAGDGKIDDEKINDKAYDRVKEAISEYEKTITLSVGQLTVGVTIPEWSGVLMLCNLKSPSAYMQAAFRTQNPCTYTENGKRYQKENAYIFDFDPARTLMIFEEFANNLSPRTVAGRGTAQDREHNVKQLLNFFPVLGEDTQGEMVLLDAEKVLSIPVKLKSQEVVRHGFMSNLLFANISNIFAAPGVVTDIINKLNTAREEKKQNKKVEGLENVSVNGEGEVEVPETVVIGKVQELFGEKVYATIEPQVTTLDPSITTEDNLHKAAEDVTENIKKSIKEQINTQLFEPASSEYDIKKSAENQIKKSVEDDIDAKLDEIKRDFNQQVNIAKAELDNKRNQAESEDELKQAESEFTINIQTQMQNFNEAMQKVVDETVKEKPQEIVEKFEKQKQEEEKKSIEDDVRDHLRGFARSIPSFIMAYGDANLRLDNFDDYTEEDVFEQVTGIELKDFRFLRDGGTYENPETGNMEYFEGHLFDEVVFNDSIQEFLRKREALKNYFDETLTEDIFEYIPPQKTNQKFTPKWMVKKMVDDLEKESPGCFDDPSHTFADLYMKSGLFITEVIKRLYRSDAMKQAYPDDKKRIEHIIKNQVYGMAPTRIIYLIATNYIFGFDDTLKSTTKHFVEADAAEAAKSGTLQQLVDQYFDEEDTDEQA